MMTVFLEATRAAAASIEPIMGFTGRAPQLRFRLQRPRQLRRLVASPQAGRVRADTPFPLILLPDGDHAAAQQPATKSGAQG